MIDDPLAVPAPIDQALPPDPAFEAQRKKVAMALMAQRGLGRPTAMGNFANSALSAWNMTRKNPGLSSISSPTSPVPNPMAGGYPTDIIGGG
jgi:hypothetical protein